MYQMYAKNQGQHLTNLLANKFIYRVQKNIVYLVLT